MSNLMRQISKPTVDWDDIRMVVFDCDGVLTDGSIILRDDESDIKRFCAQDGMGIYFLIKAGLIPVVITGRKSAALNLRCAELNIEHQYQGISNKLKELDDLLLRIGLNWKNVAYMGDDWNDVPSMARAAVSACPADAPVSIREVVDWVSMRKGGKGAVRDFVELILLKKRILSNTIEAYLASVST